MSTVTNGGAMGDEKYWSVAFLSDRYDVDPSTIWRWVKSKWLPEPVPLGPQCTRWKASEVVEYEARKLQLRRVGRGESRRKLVRRQG